MTVSTIGTNTTQTPTEHRSSGSTGSKPVAIGAGSAQKGSVARAGDTVHISSQAIDLQGLEAHINELPEVDSARVADLRAQIANGQYEINPSRIADKLLGFEAELA
ncbi:MAG: flagellar biosynthesis anti-sigma factor FlgM [Pseudohongiellaceae bacterium]|nr:flagellar biosynthesis anti-sigma factor FlgM [Pseudohongiellaceae bacterium]